MTWGQIRDAARVIETKYAGTRCGKCGRAIPLGEPCLWLPPGIIRSGDCFLGGKRRCLHLSDSQCDSADARAID